MNKEQNEDKFKELAHQLSCPTGKLGIKTGNQMNISNGNMTKLTIDFLDIDTNNQILEIGPGNGMYTDYVLSKAENIIYTGIDISQTMIDEATTINNLSIKSGNVSFQLFNGQNIPFNDNYFDKIFSVNTLYFWSNPLAYTKEIYRILKPGSSFCLAFADKDFMAKLPFTQYGFQLYDRDMAESLLKDAFFSIEEIKETDEEIESNIGELVKRPIIIFKARK